MKQITKTTLLNIAILAFLTSSCDTSDTTSNSNESIKSKPNATAETIKKNIPITSTEIDNTDNDLIEVFHENGIFSVNPLNKSNARDFKINFSNKESDSETLIYNSKFDDSSFINISQKGGSKTYQYFDQPTNTTSKITTSITSELNSIFNKVDKSKTKILSTATDKYNKASTTTIKLNCDSFISVKGNSTSKKTSHKIESTTHYNDEIYSNSTHKFTLNVWDFSDTLQFFIKNQMNETLIQFDTSKETMFINLSHINHNSETEFSIKCDLEILELYF